MLIREACQGRRIGVSNWGVELGWELRIGTLETRKSSDFSPAPCAGEPKEGETRDLGSSHKRDFSPASQSDCIRRQMSSRVVSGWPVIRSEPRPIARSRIRGIDKA